MIGRGAACAGLVALAQGCAPKPPPPPAEVAALPPHFGPPPAATCRVPAVSVPDGGTQSVTMTVGSDGGYCAITLVAANGAPYDAGLEPVRPKHGRAVIIRYNGRTSVEYTPATGYVGADAFTARLIVRDHPGYTTLNVAVTVTK